MLFLLFLLLLLELEPAAAAAAAAGRGGAAAVVGAEGLKRRDERPCLPCARPVRGRLSRPVHRHGSRRTRNREKRAGNQATAKPKSTRKHHP